MQILLILALILATFCILFALQNAEVVTLDLIIVQLQSSLALVLLITLGLGIIIGLLVSGYNLFSKTLQIAKQNKQIKELEKVIEQSKPSEKSELQEKLSESNPNS